MLRVYWKKARREQLKSQLRKMKIYRYPCDQNIIKWDRATDSKR